MENEHYKIGGSWGDTISWFSIESQRVVGWKRRAPKVGDMLESEMESGKIGVFRFVEVERQRDPPDMFFGTVEFVKYGDS